MKKMVYILISVTGLLVAGLLISGCGFSVNKEPSPKLTGISITQNHMDFGQCYSFYLREENGKVLFDAEVRFDEEPYTIILEGCEVAPSCIDEIYSLDRENGITDYVNGYKEKTSLFSADDATVNKTTVYFEDGTSKTAHSKDEHIAVLYEYFFELSKEYADKSVYVKE